MVQRVFDDLHPLGPRRCLQFVRVMAEDAVDRGLVASLARPGGNITGTTSLSVDLPIKRLELLKEAVPKASQIAVIWNPDNPWHPITVRGLQDGRRSLRVQLQLLPLRGPDDFDGAYRAILKEPWTQPCSWLTR
jgi:putative tryptophan/tyrosine transport system substrate-binding protein